MAKGCRRLQGQDFIDKKDELNIIHYLMSNNYHIKGIYKDTYGNLYSHWLNNEEIKELLFKILNKCQDEIPNE